MIAESIITAIITGSFSTIGAIVGILGIIEKKSREEEIKDTERETRQAMRLDAIEKKLDIHNGYAEKFGDIQKDIAIVKKDIEYLRKERS